ncbi:killer cell lectin-like receptor subfamily B member 1B allele B [Mauremys reevesii]|uniref:killer cell lectin-like receptor subfamily B member 1B allele B n=1 Tax=Mauremys reevesii TaxID=260615 RepID=UPI00193FC2CF|nr:killer cell lectin-like receptor subfamily B member 1B allele B [Mauremys reevesii]
MAGEIVPADLNIAEDPSSGGKVAPSQHHNHPRCPRWHLLALGLTLAGNIVLLRVVMALAVRGSLDPSLTRAVPKTMENETSAEPSPKGRGSSDLDEFRSHLRQHLCFTQNKKPAEGSSCKLCPKDWLLHGDKCYWVSKAIKGWEQSREDCLMKRAQLLVINDWEEMVFVGNSTQDQRQMWIGLNITSPGRTWTWQDGSPLNQTLFPVFDPAKENKCASVKKNKIHSEICQTELKWICQKAAVLV